MKTFFVTSICFFLFLAGVSAQGIPGPKSTLKVGFSTVYLGTGEYFGKHRFVEYDRSLLKFASVGLSGAWSNATQNDDNGSGVFLRTKAMQADAHLYLAPIHNNINRLRFGFGGSFRHTEVNEGELSPIIKNDALGYSVVSDYEFYIAKHIIVGARAAFQKYDNEDKVFYWGLNAGIRF